MAKLYLGIDLGGTEVKIAVVDALGKIREEKRIPNSSMSAPEKIIGEIIAASLSMKDIRKVCGTGVGVAGDIDQKKGVVRFSPNLPKWRNVPLRKILEKKLPRPVVIDNDANAAALGAYWLDAGGKVKNLVCITLGTGVGGGLVLEGKLFRGATGTAGEIGHMPYDPEGPACKCSGYGCIERYLGAQYLSMQAQEAIAAGGGKIMMKLANGDPKNITPRIISDAATQGDADAKTLWDVAGFRLGVVLAGVVNLINPEMIVISGGVSRAGKLILDPIKKTVRERAFKTPADACKIIISKSTHQLGVVGSALLAK
jgi:glucokinase